jgi:hypothetical protein
MDSTSKRSERRGLNSKFEYWGLGLSLVIALIHGLVYIFLVPPWQHYDEPMHFEHAWLAANLGRLPHPGDSDPELSRTVMRSMVAHNFFGKDATLETVLPSGQPALIFGVTQLDEPHLYYLVASIPLRLLRTMDIDGQLRAVRLVSLGFLLLTVYVAWGLAREITRPGNPLRWALPLSIALLPAFVDLMTAVNNDAAAVGIFSLFLWAAVRMIWRGFHWLDFAWGGLAAVACFYTKSTAMIALALFPLALLFSLLRGNRRWIAWALTGAAVLILLGSTLFWGDARYWYRSTEQAVPARALNPQAVLGEHVLQIDTAAEVNPSWLVSLLQPVPDATGAKLKLRPYTLGAWVWADRPTKIKTPVLGLSDQVNFNLVDIDTEPRFFAVTGTFPDRRFNRLWVHLDPEPDQASQGAMIYYDGLVVADGVRPLDSPPEYGDSEGLYGEWGGQPFQNLLRNPSAEQAGFRFRPWVDQVGARILPDQIQPSFIITYLLDWQGASWSYHAIGDRLFRTFWGYFGWGNVPMLGKYTFWILLAFTIVGITGMLVWMVQKLRRSTSEFPWELAFFLGVVILLAWSAALVRGSIYLSLPKVYLPVARYAFIAIIPTMLVIVGGWITLLNKITTRLHWSSIASGAIVCGLFVALDILAIFSIARFY